LLELKEITKIYDKNRVALDGVSFQMNRGEFICLSGLNQAGKTTLLKLISFEESLTSGEVIFDQFTSRTLKRKQIPLWRRKIGRIYPDFKLISDLNLFNNIALGLRIGGMKENQIKNRIYQVTESMGLRGKEDLFPEQLSAGEKQKVAFARAIVKEPLLLLADEPTLNLDERNKEDIRELLRHINLLGTAVILATRDSSLDNKHPMRIIRLDKGRIV
jgi:cell division transport system ATP-binding protein